MGKKVVQLSDKNKIGGTKMDVLTLKKSKVVKMQQYEEKEDEAIASLKASGKRLNDYFQFSQGQINEAIKEARKEWK